MFGVEGIKKTLGAQFYACGKKNLPLSIKVNGEQYEFVREFKHDFFAATGLYRLKNGQPRGHNGSPDKIVLKLSRQQNLLGLPMEWLGESICEREIDNIRRLGGIERVPNLMERWGKTGVVYEYIEGRPLNEKPDLPEGFFDDLVELLRKVHSHNLMYIDMNKGGNILVGDDGKPYIIDFQISVNVPDRVLVSRRLSSRFRDLLARADMYHVYKQKRKLQPGLITERERRLSYQKGSLITLHRFAANPLKRIRRAFMRFLRRKGFLFRDGQPG